MKYEHKMEISLSRKQLVDCYSNAETLKDWQPNLRHFEHLSGTAGEVGAKSKLVYKIHNHEVAMVETITDKNLPDEYILTYETDTVWNEVANIFMELGASKTLWICKNEFRCKGIMNVLLWLIPNTFKKQSYKYMLDFKRFAESNG